jgi:hypothetical protein
MVFALASVSPVIRQLVPPTLIDVAVVAFCIVGIGVDVRAIVANRLSVGLSRQTPKALIYLGENAWITPYIWGFDTGLIWTTFRVSFASWLLLIMAALGFAPAWAGFVYGACFALPFLALIFVSSAHFPGAALARLRPAQGLGVASMVLVVVAILSILARGA